MADPVARQRHFEKLLLAHLALDRLALKDRRRPRMGAPARYAVAIAEAVPAGRSLNPNHVYDADWSVREPVRAAAAQLTEDALALTVYDVQLFPRVLILEALGAVPAVPRTKVGRMLQRAINENGRRR